MPPPQNSHLQLSAPCEPAAPVAECSIYYPERDTNPGPIINPKRTSLKAFTLIELSIVLVVIGLIVGGVLVGRDLIKSAEIRSGVTQVTELNMAVSTFYGKYGYLPGDIPNPGFFGLSNYPGNGDGIIEDGSGNYPIASASGEPSFFTFHLVDAGLIKFKYKLDQPLPYSGVVDYQYMRSKIGNGGIIGASQANGKTCWFFGITNITPGGNPYMLSTLSTGGIMTPSDAYALDQKMDDGLPLSGVITSTILPAVPDTTANNCITSTAQNSYNTSKTSTVCNLMIQYK